MEVLDNSFNKPLIQECNINFVFSLHVSVVLLLGLFLEKIYVKQ